MTENTRPGIINPVSKPVTKPKILLAVVSTAVVVIAAGLVYLAWSHFAPHQPYKHAYSSLIDYKLTGQGDGHGVSFKKPVEFGSVEFANFAATHPGNNTDMINLSEVAPNKVAKTTPGTIATESIVSALPTKAGFVALAQKTLANPKDSSYPNFIRPLNQFLSDQISSRFSFSFGSAKVFSNSSIKSNAWQFDFTGLDSGNHKDKAQIYNLQGKLVYAIGKNAYYYFVLATVPYNWQSNHALWQQVLDSIKIDQ